MDRDQILHDLLNMGFSSPDDLCVQRPNDNKRRTITFRFIGPEFSITSYNIMQALSKAVDTEYIVVRRIEGESVMSDTDEELHGFYYQMVAHNCLIPLHWRD